MTILWLQPANLSPSYEHMITRYMRESGIPLMNIRKGHFTHGMWKKRTKTIYQADPSQKDKFDASIRQLQPRPEVIIIQDRCALEYISGTTYSLARARGGVYLFECDTQSIPCIVIDDPSKVNTVRHGGWILVCDLQKIKRWYTGTQRPQVSFSYRVCRNLDDARQFEKEALASICMAMDVETSGRGKGAFITSHGYSLLQPDGSIRAWVVPIFNAGVETGCHWPSTGDETEVRKILKRVNAGGNFVVMQNGSYDSHYYIKERIPVKNYVFDTAHAFHAIWPEAPKRIDFISSWALDYYQYWKDVGKETDKEDVKGQSDASKLPSTKEGMENYWLYNALDCYHTLLDSFVLLPLLQKQNMQWALTNYVGEFIEQMGPALQCSVQGLRVNKELKDEIEARNRKQAENALQVLRHMVDDEEFNPASPYQVASLIYDVYKATPIKQKGKKANRNSGRSADEKILKLIQTQHPVIDIIIEQIWKYKKPLNNAAKYGSNLWLMNDRWYFKMGTGTTTTWRYNSKNSDWWIGTQVQNAPRPGTAVVREMVEPDEGYVFIEKDYSQCDAYFVAMESQEPRYMELMLSDKDSHLVHMAQFFHRNYDELVELRKAGDQATEDARYDTKRIVHGSNYWMAGFTLFLHLGKRDCERIAIRLGYQDAPGWGVKQYVQFCQQLIDFYFDKMYPGLKPWAQNEFIKAARNGNRTKAFGGKTRVFFGNILRDKEVQRGLIAFKGQGGTAGLINQAFQNLWYGSWGRNGKNMVLTQTHDSFLAQTKIDNLEACIAGMDEAMDLECEVHGRKFHIPIDTKVGFGWGKRMVDWHPGMSINEVRKHDRQWWKKWNSDNPPVTTRVG